MATKLSEYSPALLSTQQDILAHWPVIEPLLKRAVMLNEYSTDNILEAALAGRMYLMPFKRDTPEGPDVRMILVMAPVLYPQLPSMTFIAVAGSNVRYFSKKFWPHIKSWCFINGVRAIDSFVPKQLEPLMNEMGFTRESIHVRTYLSGD